MRHERPGAEGAEISEDARRKFFHDLAMKYLPEMRLLFRGGKLVRQDNWRNVVEHCLTEAAAAEALAYLLGLHEEETIRLAQTAAVHDWAKRLEKNPEQFTSEEIERARRFLARLNPDETLMDATTPGFLERGLRNESSLLERIQWYIDDISRGSEIVRFKDRVADAERRNPELNENPELTAKLGGRYWEKEREFGHMVEQELFAILRNRGHEIDAPEEIPDAIKGEITRRIIDLQK